MGMDPDRRKARAATKEAISAVKELLAEGIVPRSVSIGDVRIEVSSYSPPRTDEEGTGAQAPRFRSIEDRIADRMAKLGSKPRRGADN